MEWGLFVAAVLLVAVLQFAVWRRLQSEDAGTPESSAVSERAHPSDRRRRSDGSMLLCPSCGAENDANFQFCRECVAQLQP